MKRAFFLIALALGLLLAACSNPPARPSIRPNPPKLLGDVAPAGAPDVVVFAVSGRCGVPCDSAPDGNYDYLGPRGTTLEVARAFADLGYQVAYANYSAHLLNHTSPISNKEEYGFLQLEADVSWVRQNWPGARLVLLGHSHGTNWTHNLLRAHPDWNFAYLIDLDGICALWEDDNAPYFDWYYQHYGNPWPTDLAKACDVEKIKVHWWGSSSYSAKDVAYDNAAINLEVQSDRLLASEVAPEGNTSFVFDYTDNKRLDGSERGIYTHVADENHSGITYPGSEALTWVINRIHALGLLY